MNVLLCHERFVFRFGVDRVLIMLGRGLAERGHRVSVMANRVDRSVVEEFSERILIVPDKIGPYSDLNEFTAEWLRREWGSLFREEQRPDVVVVAGWPFIAAISVWRNLRVPTVFVDCGVVPFQGYSEGHIAVLQKLVQLRRNHLNDASAIVGISEFIVESQSRVDAPGASRLEAILLGADHMTVSMWADGNVGKKQGFQVAALSRALEDGARTILNLGRWEPGCYKNSEAILLLAEITRTSLPNAVFLILADPRKVEIPTKLRGRVIPIGFPDDRELQAIMARVDLGVSVSLWEGFNLPLAEMQWLGKPALVFDRAAHPEVVCDPWFLCRDLDEMADKAARLLTANGLDSTMHQAALERFRARFAWRSAIDRYEALLERVSLGRRPPGLTIIVDVTNATRDPANSGVIRVTRRLCRELQRFCKPTFAVWAGPDLEYVFPTLSEYLQLSQFNGPAIDESYPVSPQTSKRRVEVNGADESSDSKWLLLTETVMEIHGRDIRTFARGAQLKLAAIFYDAIPVIRPELVKDVAIRENHARYMAGLAQCDLVMPISEFSASALRSFWSERGLSGCEVRPHLLAGDVGDGVRGGKTFGDRGAAVRMLCVSTLEPRKNHRRLIEAVRHFAQENPAVAWTLTLVGNRYAGGDDIADFVEKSCQEEPRIRWLGVVDDDRLRQAYAESSFTIYASEIEGFGLPILESVWHGTPCLCHERGVMVELAAEGGCLTTDVTDIEKFAQAIASLALDVKLRERLADESRARTVRDWSEYGEHIYQELVRYGVAGRAWRDSSISELTERTQGAFREKAMSWQSLVYDGCLTEEWQMNDSERAALAAILARRIPDLRAEYPHGPC